MDHVNSVYEPKLVNLWSERYRRFETDEMIRLLRDGHAQLRHRLGKPPCDDSKAA